MFTIYKGTKKIGQTADTSFLVDGLSPDTEYTLGVSRTVDGVESAVTKVSSKTKPLPVKPLKPTGLRVTQKDEKSITVVWNKVAGERYNIYLGDARVKQGDDSGTHTFGGLLQDKEYVISVEATRNDMTSEAANLTVRTDKINPPFNVREKDLGDEYAEVYWDCDAPAGTARFNIYLDDKLLHNGFIGRSYLVQDLESSTTYVISVTAFRDDQETGKSSLTITTHAPIGAGEPQIPEVSELKNLLHPIGDFETTDESGVPSGWVPNNTPLNQIELTDEWVKHGEKGLKLTATKSDMTPYLDHYMTLPKGKYIAITDYKKPTSWEIIIEGETLTSHDAILSFGETFIQLGKVDESIMYAPFEVVDNKSVPLSLAGRSLDKEGEAAAFYFDALRVYKLTPELYNYIKAGKMHRSRIKEVLPYVGDGDTVEPLARFAADVATYHVGGGYYDIDGERVRGKEAAQALLNNKEVK